MNSISWSETLRRVANYSGHKLDVPDTELYCIWKVSQTTESVRID